ncbi:alpha/beta hydrolase [Candidatus Spongiihabitans sp.]|uniref:alpha/beta hydrolase n=1 Tax=Candidatus Spongiihabitans sp. TaxID=3101308 RepID=UPI003C6EA5C1
MIEQDNNPKGEPAIIDSIEMQTGIDPICSIIWLHGLGADGHDFEFIVPELGLPRETPVRFIFPHAPIRPITVNNGMNMRGWYDIADLPIDADCPERSDREGVWRSDREGMQQSAQIVYRLIEQENQRGIATEKIFLAGFSQGGAIALFAGLRLQAQLAGIIALSAYLPDETTIEAEKSTHNQSTPIFMGHGIQDPLIPLPIATRSHLLLRELGYDVEWHTYEMPHSIHPNEIEDLANYLNKHLVHSAPTNNR